MSAVYARQEYEKKYRREHRDKLREQKRAWDADPVNKERRRAYNAKVKRKQTCEAISEAMKPIVKQTWNLFKIRDHTTKKGNHDNNRKHSSTN